MKTSIILTKVFEDDEYLLSLSSSLNGMSILYRITNIDLNKSYIGTTDKLYNRINNSLIGHKIKTDSYLTDLYSDIRKYGTDRFVFIIEEVGDSTYINSLEESYINLYDSFYNGYNRNLNGKIGCLGLICITSLDEPFIMRKVKPNEAKELINTGLWRLGGLESKSKGRIYLFNETTNDRKMVSPSEVPLLLENGYSVTRGFSPTKGKISVIDTNTGKCIRVTEDELNSNDNLIKGRNYGSTKDKVRVTNGVINKFINKNELEEYLNNGFRRGGITKKGNKRLKGRLRRKNLSSTTIETTDDNKSGKE